MIVLTIEPIAVRDILITKHFPHNPFLSKITGFPLNQRYLGYGLASQSDYQKWRQDRALFNPGFHRKYLKYLKR